MTYTTRPDETKCFKQLHDWTPENIYTGPDGKQTCRPCKTEARRAHLRGEAHPKNSGHCRKGHAYTPENTRKKVHFRNGKKEIHRQCIRCELDAQRTRR